MRILLGDREISTTASAAESASASGKEASSSPGEKASLSLFDKTDELLAQWIEPFPSMTMTGLWSCL